MSIQALHKAVLVQEAIELLQVTKQTWYLDLTFGRGGHTQAILDQGGLVVAVDCDQEAIEYGQINFENKIANNQLILIRENFSKLTPIMIDLKKKVPELKIHGIIADFGTSVDQLKSKNRGFSFDSPTALLDMRMDDRLGVTALDLLKILPLKQLKQLFIEYGGEKEATAIAKAIVKLRESGQENQLNNVGSLVDLIVKTKKQRSNHLHQATHVFQALRIAVNSELDNIREMLPQAYKLLEPQGRLITIAFHEGEDRVVKSFMKQKEQQQAAICITHKPITPKVKELTINPRSRSAKLRALQKIN